MANLQERTVTRKNGETVTITLIDTETGANRYVVQTTYGGRGSSRTLTVAQRKFADLVKFFSK